MLTRIQKPTESDPDYLTQQIPEGWRYLLAFDYRLQNRTPDEIEAAWEFIRRFPALGNYRPLPQARKFHRSTAHFRWCLGGNRSSKSHSLAVETVWQATGWHPFQSVRVPSVGWYATTTVEKIADTLWAKLDPAKGGLLQGIDHEVVWRSKQWNIPGRVLIPVKGGTSEIVFKAYQQDRESFQAVDLDYAHFDEQFARDIFIETLTRIGPGRKIRFAAAMTPIDPQPWLEERLSNHKTSDAVFEYPLDDNRISWGGFIDDEAIDSVIDNWPPEVRDTRRYGKWGSFLGAVYQTFSREVHVVSEEKERELFFINGALPPGTRSVGGIDWGGSNPFVYLLVARIPHLDNDYYVIDEYYWNAKERGGRRLEQHAEEIKAMHAKWGLNPERIWADHDPTDAFEMNGYGVVSIPADKDKLPGIDVIRTLFNPRKYLSSEHWPKGRPRLHFAARCTNSIREIAGYRWKEGTENADAKDEPVKKDDHTCDTIRYIVYSEKPYDGATGGVPNLGQSFAYNF